MKRITLFVILISVVAAGLAQEKKAIQPYLYPYDDVLIKKVSAEDPGLATKYLFYEENLKSVIAGLKAEKGQNMPKADTLIDGKRIVPVVFHIIHHGGAENISREQIEDAIARINIDYNKLNADTGAGNTYPAFDALRADCKIEFRLAKIDPDGNCTDGIVRHYDPQTNYAYFQTMTDYCWSPSRYMNIFTVNFIYPEGMALPDGAFIGGMSPFPPSNALTQALTGGDTLADGVLIRHDCIGSIGTAIEMGGMPINALNRSFTHESGHYFNLYHPFQAGPLCVLLAGGDGCGSQLFGCGDEVDDTPPVHAASQNTGLNCFVPGSRNTCSNDSPNLPDMVENYMDYQWGYCTNLFTLGQLDRIDATMMGDRRKLWSKENLLYTGVLDTNASVCAPVAEFFSNSGFVCAGGNIQFTDYSYSGTAQNWMWTFQGGTPAASTDQNPLITYNTPGIYYVKLEVSNAHGADSLIKQDMIMVKPATPGVATPFVENFESVVLNNGWFVANDAGNSWQITDTAAYSGSKSIRLKNYTGNNYGSYDEFITPAYDLTSLPTGGSIMVKFKLAYAGKITPGSILTSADTAFDALKMYVSKDCGETWVEKYSGSGPALATANATENSFAPAAQTGWLEIVRPLPYNFITSDNVMLKFEFHANGGNNIYIDDLNITTSVAGFDENMMASLNFSVQPNPVADASTIRFDLEVPAFVNISVYDILGNEIKTLADGKLDAGAHSVEMGRSVFGSSGIYLIKATIDGNTLVKKIAVQ